MIDDLGRRRGRVPAWWADAKLGIFVHWGLFAVPAFAPVGDDLATLQASRDPDPFAYSPYAEWYENSLRFPDSPVSVFHRETYGDRPYADFVDPFIAGLASWDPQRWAHEFAATGATYVVFVAKHHDGFCLWPTAVDNPNRAGWHTTRDVVGELAEAVRANGMRFGIYYSGGLDWTFNTQPIGTFGDLLAAMPGSDYPAYADAQVRELIERYRPSVLWNDILWPTSHSRLMDLFGRYFEMVPDGVVNDRWLTTIPGSQVLKTRFGRSLLDRAAARSLREGPLIPPKPRFFQFRTPEFATFPHISFTPWECVRGMDHGFGYNRASVETDFLTRDELLRSVVDIAAKGGNLLLNVGPRGDAQIPDEQLTRLGWLGEHAAAHNASIVGTRPWIRAQDRSTQGHDVRYTAYRDTVWVHYWYPDVTVTPPSTLTLPFRATTSTTVTRPNGTALSFHADGHSITVEVADDADLTVSTIGIHHAGAGAE